jgi:hypothetical protein
METRTHAGAQLLRLVTILAAQATWQSSILMRTVV